jgi:tetratricopeptide (TPR) repeat protein
MSNMDNDEGYFNTLKNVFSKNQNNISVLLGLAETYLQKDEYERAENLAQHALEILEKITKKDETRKDVKVLHSNLLVLKGKIQHIKEDFNKASKFYEDAKNV